MTVRRWMIYGAYGYSGRLIAEHAKAKGLTMSVSGRHGLDQDMRYRVATEVPIDSLTSKLAAEVQKLGIDPFPGYERLPAEMPDAATRARIADHVRSM